MVTYYNRKDLVSFGDYLLSEERKGRIAGRVFPDNSVPIKDRLSVVYHADIENWKESVQFKKEHDINKN